MGDTTSPPWSWRESVSVGLIVAAVLLIAAAVVQPFGFHGVSFRDRAFATSQQIGLLPTALALAALLIVTTGAVGLRRGQRVVNWAALIGIVGGLSSLYTIGYVLLVHERFPPPVGNSNYVAFVSTSAAYRTSAAFEALAGLTLAVVLLGAVRRVGSAARTPTATAATR